MRKSPLTVQQWVDTLPTTRSSPPNPINNNSPRRYLLRDTSFQSDDAGSHCSSVESVLELRKPNPETVLLELGFGPSKNPNIVSKIPNRFLQPSRLLSQIDIDKFLEQYGVNKFNEHSNTSSPSKSRTNN